MMKLAPILVLLALVACTYTPRYTGINCGPDESCPDGYVCIQESCQQAPEEPSGEEPAEEVGQDGDAGMDDGADMPGDGDQATDDGAADQGDEGCGGCPPGQYCDENEIPPDCKRCEDPTHCGIDCQPCDPGESCNNMSGTFCCFPLCDASNLCELVSCGGRDFVCRAFFGPLRYDWNAVESNPPHWCRLSDAEGPILDDLRCRDGDYLQFYCPWDGICAGGLCVHNPAVERTHYCGGSFGCEGDQQAGHCRMHRQDGESCYFNYDCESFCCSQDNNAQCIAYNASLCKIHTTLYWDDVIYLYTWIAKGTTDFHDTDEWTDQADDQGAKCTGDAECDSGSCRHWISVGENRCEFDGCVNTANAAGIRSSYFCPLGDHTQHMTLVTNQNPVPPPGDCPE